MTADVHTLAGAYALDALPESERVYFEQHLNACDECRSEVGELLETASRLGSAAAQPPPAGLRDRVLAAVDVTRQLPPAADPELEQGLATVTTLSTWQRVRERALVGIAACLALAVVGLGLVSVNLNRQLDQQSGDLVAVLGAPDMRTASLDMGAEGPARFVFSASLDRGVLVGEGMRGVNENQTYELWLIHDGKPVPAGLFRPGDDGTAVAQAAAPVRGADLVAVTIEPAGGSDAPTGSILASAEL